MFLFLILLISCWVVAASLMAEKNNVGVAVFIADTTSRAYVWFRVGWSCCPPFCVLACPLRQSSVCLPLSPGFVLEHFSTLQWHSVDVDILHISHADIFISQVRAACGSPPQCQITADDVFWNATVLHTVDMTQPHRSLRCLSRVYSHVYWEGVRPHETGHQRWLLCPARICPGYNGCFSGGMC